MLDGPEMVFAFFGAIKIGAVPIPINTLWTPADYEFVLQDSRAPVVIVSASLYPKIAEVIPRCPWVRHVVAVARPADDGRRSISMRCSTRLRPTSTPSRPAATRRVLAVLVGQHGRAQRLRAPAPRHGLLYRALRARRAGHHRA